MYPQSNSAKPNAYYLEQSKDSTVKVAAQKTGKILYLILQSIIGLLVIFILLYLFILPINIVDGPSMEPNFCNSDIYFTYKLDSYFERNPYKKGDVIAFKKDANSNLIKRIVGMPGDRVLIERGRVYINGQMFNEVYLQPNVVTSASDYLQEGIETTVPKGKYLALGDNRPVSLDSRDIGPIDPIDNAINGKVILIIWPPMRMRVFDPNAKFPANECKVLS